MKVSIVVITWNQLANLKKCLGSIFRFYDPEYELIVVDNNSTDGTIDFLKSTGKINHLILNDRNYGVAFARNQGMRVASGDYVLLLDDDAMLLDSVIHRVIKYMDAHPDIGLLGPRLVGEESTVQISARKFPTLMSFCVRFWHTVIGIKVAGTTSYSYGELNIVHEVDWVIGACQFIRKNVLGKVGFLDEGYFYGYEDVDFCRRIWLASLKVVYHPEFTVFHKYQRKSAKGFYSNLQKQHVKSLLRYFRKHGIRFL